MTYKHGQIVYHRTSGQPMVFLRHGTDRLDWATYVSYDRTCGDGVVIPTCAIRPSRWKQLKALLGAKEEA